MTTVITDAASNEHAASIVTISSMRYVASTTNDVWGKRTVTVLAEYQRLEAEGVWRADEDAQRRDVIVSIGEATLTLTDLNEIALTHWSLPAIRRQNPGTRPAIYAPGNDASETLEIADGEMIDAVEKVLRAVRKQGRHPGRLRAMIYGGAAAACIVLGTFWLPDALASYISNIIPEATRASIGTQLSADIERLTGRHCEDPSGSLALDQLKSRLFPNEDVIVFVLPSALATTQHLPGGTILASHKLVEDFETAEVFAGYLIAENQRRKSADPFERLLQDAGLRAAFGLLTTGDLSIDVLRGHAETLVANEPRSLTAEELATAFATSEIKPDDYVKAAAPSEDVSAALIGVGATIPSAPLLTDSAWIALQQICEDDR